MILNEGLKRFIILPTLPILEFRGEIDISLADHFQDIILKRLDSSRLDIATLKRISATFSDPIAEKFTLPTWHIRHNETAGIECFINFM